MSKLGSLSSNRRASDAFRTLASASFTPAAALLSLAVGLFASGCGGGGAVVVAPCYGYGCGYGYGYGYGAVSTVPTTGIGNSVPASNAQLKQPVALAIDSSGNSYVADRVGNTVRQVAGSTGGATSGSGGNTSANLKSTFLASHIAGTAGHNNPTAVALDSSGNLYVINHASSTIRRVSASTGTVAIVVGSASGNSGYSGDGGPAIAAQLNHPSGMAFDRAANLYIADTGNHRIRRVDASTGVISTFAGDGTQGYSGDGGPASAAQLWQPVAVAADNSGNLYIADAASAEIRKVDARTGVISTVAGNGISGFSGDNAAASAAQLNDPHGIAVDAHGNLFITDTGNQRIREVSASTGIISTIVGNGNQGYSGDGGPSSRAALNNPEATAIDTSGNLYIADSGNGVIRKVLPNPEAAPKSN